jgi:hypothetical protein
MTPRLLIALCLALIVGACGSSTSSDDIGSFEEIAVAEPVFEFDPSATTATLTIETTIDVACFVSYGIDAPAGSIATDNDMGATGAHADHMPLLTGLEPDTEYQYRLQGVGIDGRLYRSDIMTVTTPSASTGSLGDNLAPQARVADVSSEFSSSFAAENAIDGDRGTEWSSQGDGDDAFITIEFGSELDIAMVRFITRSMGDGSATTNTISIVADGERFGPFPTGEEPIEVDIRARSLTFEVESSTGGNTGAVEIEVYGP